MEKSRVAQVGDLLIERVGNFRYVGVIYNITYDNYSHKSAFIKWVRPPNCYRADSGYSTSNIHNLRQRFDLVKA